MTRKSLPLILPHATPSHYPLLWTVLLLANRIEELSTPIREKAVVTFFTQVFRTSSVMLMQVSVLLWFIVFFNVATEWPSSFCNMLILWIYFQHAVFSITWLLAYIIPDNPVQVALMKSYETELVKKLRFDFFMSSSRGSHKSGVRNEQSYRHWKGSSSHSLLIYCIIFVCSLVACYLPDDLLSKLPYPRQTCQTRPAWSPRETSYQSHALSGCIS